MTTYSDIKSMKNGEIVALVEGEIRDLEAPTTEYSKTKFNDEAKTQPKSYQRQKFTIYSPEAETLYVSTLESSLFLDPTEYNGKLVRILSQPRGAGKVLQGVKVNSYKRADETYGVSLDLGKGTLISLISPPQPTKDAPKAKETGKDEPRQVHPKVKAAAQLWADCFHTLNPLVDPRFGITELVSATTTLFIQLAREGLHNVMPEKPKPLNPAERTEPPKTAADPSPASPPSSKLPIESLATKIISHQPIPLQLLGLYPLDKLYDLCMTEAIHEVPQRHINQAFDLAKAKFKDETKTYQFIFQNWKRFMDKAEGFRKTEEAASGVVE